MKIVENRPKQTQITSESTSAYGTRYNSTKHKAPCVTITSTEVTTEMNQIMLADAYVYTTLLHIPIVLCVYAIRL